MLCKGEFWTREEVAECDDMRLTRRATAPCSPTTTILAATAAAAAAAPLTTARGQCQFLVLFLEGPTLHSPH